MLHAELEALRSSPGPDPRLTLGMIAACGAWADVCDLWRELCHSARDIAVALDTDDAALAAARQAELVAIAPGRSCHVIAHPLDRDFAAQRNRVQQVAQTEWVLQLDCDECLTPMTSQILPGILDDADRHGWVAVALTRRNMVDGVVSALYPDVQYRLLRRSIRFKRAVHEYPELRADQPSFAHLGAGIVHTLANVRLGPRETVYDAIEPGAGRPHDTALLRRPLEPTVRVTR